MADVTQADEEDPEKIDDLTKLASVMYAGTHNLLFANEPDAMVNPAGVDTSLTPVQFAILNAILHPEIQRRAQTELDSIIGSPDSQTFRFPTFEDVSALPYITALVKEGLRWAPSLPINIPHASVEEGEFRGWRIPKGSAILPNAWTMLHDEKTYKDPFEFRPQRFLASKGHEPEPDPSDLGVFGFGRRCVTSLYCSLQQ